MITIKNDYGWRLSMQGFTKFNMLPLAAPLLLLAFAGTLQAQVTAGAISGTVTDPTGAAIPGATVTVTNQDTGVSGTSTTDSSGFYSAEALYAGTYAIDISKAGFKESITRRIQIDPGQRRANNVALVIGDTTSQVTVTADTAQVNTETSESSGTVTATQVSNLMLNGRDFQTLAIMIPGVASDNAADNLSNSITTELIVNGQSSEFTTYTIDGVYNMNSGSNAEINIVPIVDGISEFRVLKDNYSAKYGYAGDAQVVVNTMSGTNTFHGTAWDYLRNDAFDASNYYSTAKQALHQNIYGFVFGGPVIIPKVYNTNRSKKTFFFSAVQWHAINAGQVKSGAMFTQAMRNGDFSSSPTLKGNLILDAPSKALLAAEGKTNCIEGPRTLNTSCFDPVAVSLMNAYWPLPNNPGGGFLNYLNQGSIITRETDYQFRVDHSINSNNVLTARVMYQPENTGYPYSTWSGNPSALIRDRSPYEAFNNLVRLTSTITPKLVNTVAVANTTDRLQYIITLGGTLPSGSEITQAFPGADPHNRIPNINLSGGWSGNGPSSEPIVASDGEGLAMDDVTWVKGNHVLQAGALYMFGIKRQTVFTYPQGRFTFSGVHTGDPAADYLLGLDATYNQTSTQKEGNFHYRQGEAYFQDDWKASRRLTLNLGMRWVYFSNDTASGDEVTSFSPSAYDPAEAPVVKLNGSLQLNSANQPINAAGQPANLLNGLLFAGKNGVPSGFFIPTKKNFGPRVGFAYDVFGNGMTSIHGGYGIGYSRIPVEQIYNAFGQNPPYNQTANIINSLLSNALAGGTNAATTQTLNNVPLSFVPTQIQSYSLTVEHQLGRSTIATVAYAGSLGRHLMTFQGGYDENFPLPVTTPSASNCLAPGQAPSASYNFDPCINTGVVSANFTRPYSGYSTMDGQYDEASSNYNSLQAGLTYNAGGSRFNVAYTYSKALGTDGAHVANRANSETTQAQNPRDWAAEYGPPSYDFTNDIVGTWVYTIPYFSHGSKPVALALGNWSLAGLALHQSGFALSPSMSTGTAGEAIRPNQVAPYRRVGTLAQWFDTSSFTAPNYGFFGNASNGSIRGPAYTSFNVALYKAFTLKERLSVQFRAEAFNVANHPNFNNVSTGVGAGNYGHVTSAGDPRNLELAIKLIY
jgi:hypothetical protein